MRTWRLVKILLPWVRTAADRLPRHAGCTAAVRRVRVRQLSSRERQFPTPVCAATPAALKVYSPRRLCLNTTAFELDHPTTSRAVE